MTSKQIPLHYKRGSQFHCDPCGRMVKGEGYLYNRKVYCVAHYKEVFPYFQIEEPLLRKKEARARIQQLLKKNQLPLFQEDTTND